MCGKSGGTSFLISRIVPFEVYYRKIGVGGGPNIACTLRGTRVNEGGRVPL